MKKNGFTLAEVLITLAIIGVVATMTLPALMTNTAEQQAKSALKKCINTLTEAGQMTQALDGYDYGSTSTTDTSENAQSVFGILSRRAAIDWSKTGTGTGLAGHTNFVGESNYTLYFRDGTALTFNKTKTGIGTDEKVIGTDGLPRGIPALFDMNGTKGPNMISNCKGTSAGISSTESDSTATDHNAQCSRTQRVIKDQIGVRLRGTFAVPNGAAARWAFDN